MDVRDYSAGSYRSKPVLTEDDRLLLLSSARGDAEAFNTLFRRHQDELRGFLYQRLHSRDEAEDALGLTFLNAWRARESFRGDSSGKSWLYMIATRVALDLLRTRRRRSGEQELDSESAEVSSALEAECPDPQEVAVEHAAGREIAHHVNTALSRLDGQEKRLVELFYFAGHDYDAISRMLGVTRSQVRGRLHRIRGRIKRDLCVSARHLFA